MAQSNDFENIEDDSEDMQACDNLTDNRQKTMFDSSTFKAYEMLRKIVVEYNLQDKLVIPRIVFVGDTSSGKSMLVQMFLRFPSAFSQANVGTRCPVQYKLRYNPSFPKGKIHFIQPSGWEAKDLGENLRKEMEKIENDCKDQGGFRLEPFVIEIASRDYRDFEILDGPGLVSGDRDPIKRAAVERITQHYVRDPSFIIIQLKEAQQLSDNTYGTRRIGELCTEERAVHGSSLPPRHDYEQHTITIQTKFDTFMREHINGTEANRDIQAGIDAYSKTYFTNMVFDVYNFAEHNYEENVEYINKVPELERNAIDEWIKHLNLEAEKPNSKHQQFNQKYRSLIGIDVVREKIYELWLRVFRSALPNLQNTIEQMHKNQTEEFKATLLDLKQQDTYYVRKNYQTYIREFRKTISDYAAFRAEVNQSFSWEKYGRTYKEIEDEYNVWNRKQSLVWRAYLSVDELKQRSTQESLPTLDLRYVGARHFERLRQVFTYMVLEHNPLDRDRGWYESAESILHGGVSDYGNVEKAARESLYTFIRETFLIGICWLTQVHSFLTDHFAQHVKSVLLAREFTHLKHHNKFLTLVDFEYHQMMRKSIRNAVLGIKQARYCKIAYAAYNIRETLENLVHSITRINQTTTDNNDDTKSSLGETVLQVVSDVAPKILMGQPPQTAVASAAMNMVIKKKFPFNELFGSPKFLPTDRDPQTANYLPKTRDIIFELYTAMRGLLLYDITTNFFANLVFEIQQYKSITIENGLEFRIHSMSDKELAHLAHIQMDDSYEKLININEQLKNLEQARDAISNATLCIDERKIKSMNNNEFDGNDIQQQIRSADEFRRNKQLKEIEKKMNINQSNKNNGKQTNSTQSTFRQKSDCINDDPCESETEEENIDDEVLDERELWKCNDKKSIEIHLLSILRKHDVEDLKLGFLPGDSLDADLEFFEKQSKQNQQQQSNSTFPLIRSMPSVTQVASLISNSLPKTAITELGRHLITNITNETTTNAMIKTGDKK